MREMRRKTRKMEDKDAYLLLENAEYGVMGTVDSEMQPYAVPLSFVVDDNTIYFHCAAEGHKIDNISNNDKVSFTVIGRTKAVYDKMFTTYFESAIVFGKARKIVDPSCKFRVLKLLARKYLIEYMDRAEHDINVSLDRTAIYAISIDYISGKEKRKDKQ